LISQACYLPQEHYVEALMKLAAYEAMRANKTEVTMLLDKRLGAGVHAKASDTRVEKTLRSRVVDYESSNDFPPGKLATDWACIAAFDTSRHSWSGLRIVLALMKALHSCRHPLGQGRYGV